MHRSPKQPRVSHADQFVALSADEQLHHTAWQIVTVLLNTNSLLQTGRIGEGYLAAGTRHCNTYTTLCV